MDGVQEIELLMNDIRKLEMLIETLRTRLHEKAQGRCFTDPEVVKASQELNTVLNKYAKLLSRKCMLET